MNEQPQNENAEQVSAEPVEENDKKKKREQDKKDDRRKQYTRIAIILIIIIIILLLLLLRQCSSGTPVLHPDYPPQQDEPNADPIPDDDNSKLDYEDGGGAVNLRFKDKMTIDLSDKETTLFFANPGRSTQDVVLWLIIQDQVILQSGRIRPGYQVDTLDLLKDAEKMLSAGVYEAMLVIYCYDPVTNERAMVNTEAPVTVTVKP